MNLNLFKVVIAGGRDFNNYELLKEKCDLYLKNKAPNIEIVSGTARGADSLGERYAKENGYNVTRFPADWDKYGKMAGFMRNKQMAEYSDALIAFWDGKSKGTKSMIQLGKNNNLKIKVIYYEI